MSTAAEYDQPYDGDDPHREYAQPCEEWDRQYCYHGRDCSCSNDDFPDPPVRGVHPADAKRLDGPAADALFGLELIRDVPSAEVPAAVMVQAVLGAQRVASYAKAQAMYWTAALARPGVAVPMSDLLDSIAHRGEEQGRGGDVPEELAERAAAGTEVVGDDSLGHTLAAEAAGGAEPELSAAWLVAPITARRRIADAQDLVEQLPATFTALEQGRIEEVRARIIAETTAVLRPGAAPPGGTAHLGPGRRGLSPGDLRRLATKIVADMDPDAADTGAPSRPGPAAAPECANLGDDLGRFTADLAVEDAALTQAVLDLLAAAIPAEARHGRGRQLRADIFADLFGELADTGLIDLRGIHPDNHPTRPTPKRTRQLDSNRTRTHRRTPTGRAGHRHRQSFR